MRSFNNVDPRRVFTVFGTKNARSPEAVVVTIKEKICRTLSIFENMTLSIIYETVYKSLLAVNLSTDDAHIFFHFWYFTLNLSVLPRSSA